jgi:hypothetical protein
LAQIADALVEQGRAQAARPLLDEALTLVADVPSPAWRATDAQEIGLTQVQAGSPAGDAFQMAERAAFAVEPADERIELLLDFAAERQEAGQTRAARDAIAAALGTSLVVADAAARARALAEIAEMVTDQDDEGWPAARTTLIAAADWAYQVEDQNAWVRSMRVVAAAEARAGLAARALDTALRLEKPEQFWALDDVAQAQAASGDYEAALHTAAHIDDAGLRARTHQSIVTILLAAGDVDAARQTAVAMREGANKDQALQAIEAVESADRLAPDEPPLLPPTLLAAVRDPVLKELIAEAAALTQAGRVGEAGHKWDAAQATADRLDDNRDDAWRAIAQAAAHVGAVDEARAAFAAALAAADDLLEEWQRLDAQTDNVIALAEARFGEQAVELAERLPDPDAEYLPELALILARHGDHHNLARLLPLCADDPSLALLATPAIATLDPAQAAAVAQVVRDHNWV